MGVPPSPKPFAYFLFAFFYSFGFFKFFAILFYTRATFFFSGYYLGKVGGFLFF